MAGTIAQAERTQMPLRAKPIEREMLEELTKMVRQVSEQIKLISEEMKLIADAVGVREHKHPSPRLVVRLDGPPGRYASRRNL